MTRDEALKKMQAVKSYMTSGNPIWSVTEIGEAFDMAIEALEQPERKTGEWNFIGNQMFECSECGICYTQSQFYQMRVLISDPEFPKFCPDCGASMMQGEQNVTD